MNVAERYWLIFIDKSSLLFQKNGNCYVHTAENYARPHSTRTELQGTVKQRFAKIFKTKLKEMMTEKNELKRKLWFDFFVWEAIRWEEKGRKEAGLIKFIGLSKTHYLLNGLVCIFFFCVVVYSKAVIVNNHNEI